MGLAPAAGEYGEWRLRVLVAVAYRARTGEQYDRGVSAPSARSQPAARSARRTPQRPDTATTHQLQRDSGAASTRWLGVCAQRDAPVVPIGTTGAVRRVNVRGVQDAAGVATAVGLVIVAPPPGLVNVSFRLLRT